ncbi:hypothetical protein PHAVU_009G192600 [Phaseolus vulgaris]|uniref:Myb/SANT-like domain-containing protein n=1 Tax=Phaseolus vulgaris TaxID=3885 RepID=V7AXF2_PHAVU|nr:hypothetical protein PHAVU_009G192600g [Phaseolus vulgaris]ESW10244.1 hypothetical protein PHAVU_009G192600g [Phaseolus vulgaris]
MDRGKNVASNSSGSYREFTKWTVEMDLILLNAMIDEAGLSGLKKNNVKNRQKSLKDRLSEVHDLFGGLNGFAWNHTTKLFEAEDEVWSQTICGEWRVNPIRHYDLMEKLWSNDRATGSRAARDINSPPDLSNFSVNLGENNMDYIPEQPNYEEADDYVPRSPAPQFQSSDTPSDTPSNTHSMPSVGSADVVVPPPTTRIQQVLDYSRYFSTRRQMVVFEKKFHARPVLPPKVMHTPFFAAPGFEFQNLLNWQGLQPFLGINLPYYEDLVRVFYTNVKITLDGLKLTHGMIPEELNFDRALALSSMIREDVEGENLKNVGSLKMNDQLLHYTWVHILCPRGSNFAQLLNENIFMLWLIKNNVRINWPHYIMQHIIKCRDNKMPLPYANLITRILQVYGFNLSNEQPIMLGWNHYFGKRSMTKLNIFQVNGVWQLGRPHHAHEEDDEEDELPAQDVEGGQPQPAIPSRTEMLTQIWTGMQDMRERMRNVNIRFDKLDERMERSNQRMDRLEDTLNQIHRQQGH